MSRGSVDGGGGGGGGGGRGEESDASGLWYLILVVVLLCSSFSVLPLVGKDTVIVSRGLILHLATNLSSS